MKYYYHQYMNHYYWYNLHTLIPATIGFILRHLFCMINQLIWVMYQCNSTPMLCSSLISCISSCMHGHFLPDFLTFLESVFFQSCIVFLSLDNPVSCAPKLSFTPDMITHTPCWTATFFLRISANHSNIMGTLHACTLKMCILRLKLILFSSIKLEL